MADLLGGEAGQPNVKRRKEERGWDAGKGSRRRIQTLNKTTEKRNATSLARCPAQHARIDAARKKVGAVFGLIIKRRRHYN